MIPVLTADEARGFDQRVIEAGVPSVVLMENAGRGAADLISAALTPAAPVLVLCGGGNNGGDGYVVARRLLTLGHQPRVLSSVSTDSLTGDARVNYLAFCAIGGEVSELSLDLTPVKSALSASSAVVDALFGTGLCRELPALVKELVSLCNQAALQRFALDVPSGLCATTGRAFGPVFQADLVITFGHLKRGLLTPRGKRAAREVRCLDIGVPQGAFTAPAEAALVEPADARRWLPARGAALHKGSAGRLSVIGGSAGKSGAALLTARGALRAGAGLVTLCNHAEALALLEGRLVEAMTRPLDPVRAEDSLFEALVGQDAVVVGPGLGLDSRAQKLVAAALKWPGPKLFDADALTAFAGRPEELAAHTGELVLTPHPLELGRLLSLSVEEVEADRYAAVKQAAERCRATVLLKGPFTLVHTTEGDPPCRINPTGGPVLATGGAGDVLSGVIGALLAQRLPPQGAAALGAYLHGLAGELWAQAHGTGAGLLASELADQLPRARAALECG